VFWLAYLSGKQLLSDAIRFLTELCLGDGGDGELTELNLCLLGQFLLLWSERQFFEPVEGLGKLVGLALYIVCVLARDGGDTTDTFSNANLLHDDKFLDLISQRSAYPNLRRNGPSLLDPAYLTCVGNVSPTAKFDADFFPIWSFYVLKKILDGYAHGHDAYWVRIGLAKDGADTENLTRESQRYVFHVDRCVLPGDDEVVISLSTREGYDAPDPALPLLILIAS
jgi:hypothetical protein